jgi:hypothetical protein
VWQIARLGGEGSQLEGNSVPTESAITFLTGLWHLSRL